MGLGGRGGVWLGGRGGGLGGRGGGQILRKVGAQLEEPVFIRELSVAASRVGTPSHLHKRQEML